MAVAVTAAKKPASRPTRTAAARKTSSKKPSVKKSSAKKSKAGKSASKQTASRKPGGKTARGSKRPAKRRTAARRVRRPAGQARPAPERYQEIQRALKQRGYFAGEADGSWDEASSAALKRFQKDQNLRPDGKLGSLSLIALGLGPRRGGAQPAAPVAPSGPVVIPTPEGAPAPSSTNDKVPR